MAMNLNSGDLYFIRERDVLSGEIADYVKIGLVKHSRQGDAEKRLAEHQTGNPRELVIVEQLSAPAVSDLEATVHDRFATRRVLGEWFDLDAAGLAEVVAVAQALADEQAENLEALRNATALKSIASTDVVREATEADREWWSRADAARLLRARVGGLRQRSEAVFRNAIVDGAELGLFAGFTDKVNKKFDTKKFAESFPELFQQFTIESEAISQRFTVRPSSTETAPELDEEFLALESRFHALLTAAEEGSPSYEELHLLHLELLRWQAEAAWRREIAEANLRASCATDAGIDGVVTWKREMKVTEKFDDAELKRQDPELYAQFVIEVPSRSFAMVPMRSYTSRV